MQLPHELQHFPKGALLVSSDHVHAKFYFIGGDSVEELDGVAMPKERATDSEGGFSGADGRMINPNADIDDGPRLKHFTKEIAELVEKYIKQHNIPAVHLVMPAEVEHLVSEHLRPEERAHVSKIIHRDLVDLPVTDVIQRVVEHLGLAS